MEGKCYSYVRFSRPEQLSGDSLRRQLELSEKYANENNLILDDSIKFHDLGISAFQGKHRTQGALSEFLNLIVNEKIQKGSVLLVESLDRLSREQVLTALNLFTGIIQAGITIVTLQDNQIYNEKTLNNNIGSLVMSLMIMSRAHEESATKSKRLKESWKNKRNNIENQKLTGKCPAWLKLSEDKKEFDILENRAGIINKIFDMKLVGKGAELISKELNKHNGIWKPKNGWRKSYINKILMNPSVIGHFQPHSKIEGKRQPIGDTITDYYPKIITEEKFYNIQNLFKQNSFYGGKTGKISNLFGHIAKCGYCKSSMSLLDKGKNKKYLVCSKANRGLGCIKDYVNYDLIENIILNYCKGLNVSDILENDNVSELEKLQDQLIVTINKIESIANDLENLTNKIQKIRDDRVSLILQNRMTELLNEKDELESNKKELESSVFKLESISKNTEIHIKEMTQLMDYMNDLTGNELIDLRLKLRLKIRQLIDHINIYSSGYPKITPEFIENAMKDLHTETELETIKSELEKRVSTIAIIHFKSGSIRSVKKDNLIFDFDNIKGLIYSK